MSHRFSTNNLDGRQKRKIRRIVFGTMLAGGALGIAGLSAQAHGNASSHKPMSLDWNFDNFVVNRDAVLTPALATNNNIFSADPTAPQLTQLSRDVLEQMRAGNLSGATALIEQSGASPDEVLSAYSIVVLDLYNFSAVDGRSTTRLADDIIQLCNVAISYQEANAPSDLESLGSFLHNLASAAMPDVGQSSAEQFRLGRQAAERAVEVRRQTGEPAKIGIALYLAGVYSYKATEYDLAERQFRESISLLENTNRLDDLAWSKAFFGFNEIARGNPTGSNSVDEARQIFMQRGNQYALQYITSYIQ